MGNPKSIVTLYWLQSLYKGFSVFYFVLLPVFYSSKLITAKEIGYIGALSIAALIFGAIIVVRSLHTLDTRKLFRIASWCFLIASILLLYGAERHNLVVLTTSFILSGLAVGIAMSGVNAFASCLTQRGSRYKTLAGLGMILDLVRILFPLLVAGSIALGNHNFAIYLIIIASIASFYFASKVPPDIYSINSGGGNKLTDLLRNNPFRYALSLEFFDSLSSSQLFVFLPILFLSKGHSLQSSLILQSC